MTDAAREAKTRGSGATNEPNEPNEPNEGDANGGTGAGAGLREWWQRGSVRHVSSRWYCGSDWAF